MSDDAELRFAVLLEEKGRLRLTGVRGIIPRLSYPVPVSQLERPTEYEHGTGGTLNFVLRGCYRGHLKVLGDSMASINAPLVWPVPLTPEHKAVISLVFHQVELLCIAHRTALSG